MVSRLVEMIVKPGSAAALSAVVENRGVPLAERSGGFIGKLVMVLREEPRIVTIASFWDKEEDVARYEQDTFPTIRALILPFLDGDVRVQTFNVTAGLVLSKLAKKKCA